MEIMEIEHAEINSNHCVRLESRSTTEIKSIIIFIIMCILVSYHHVTNFSHGGEVQRTVSGEQRGVWCDGSKVIE